MTRLEEVAAGINIASKYDGDINAEHDVIYIHAPGVSQDDVDKLCNELGWGAAYDDDAFQHFV